MVTFMRNSHNLKLLLLGYWSILSVGFLLFLLFLSSSKQISILTLLNQDFPLTLGFLTIFLTILQIYFLTILSKKASSQNNYLKKFTYFSTVQQLVTLNIIGFFLSLFLYFSLPSNTYQQQDSRKTTYAFYLLLLFLSFLTLILVYGRIQSLA